MSLSQRKDGRWLVKYKANGKWIQRAFRSETEARAFETEQLQAEAAEEQRLTLGELAMLYFRSRPDFNRVTKKTIVYALAGHENAAGAHVDGPAEFLRDKYADALTRQDLERLRESLRVRGCGNNTLNHYQAYIRAILAWGVDQDLISYNPWQGYKLLRHNRPIIHASIDNFRRIYEQLPEYLQWAAQTAFFLALRPGIVELFMGISAKEGIGIQEGCRQIFASVKLKTVHTVVHQLLQLSFHKGAVIRQIKIEDGAITAPPVLNGDFSLFIAYQMLYVWLSLSRFKRAAGTEIQKLIPF